MENQVSASRRLSLSDLDLLRSVIERTNPALTQLVKTLPEISLSPAEIEEIREVLAAELSQRGLDDQDEPNAYGLQMEDLIDKVGDLRRES